MDGLIGLISNTLSTSIVHPIDVTKTRNQVNIMYNKSIPINKVIMDIYKGNGVRGFYKGLGPQLMTYPFFWGIYFQTSSATKRYYGDIKPSFMENAFITFGSASLASSIVNPLFVLKTRMQTSEVKTSAVAIIKQLYKENGLKSAYKGLPSSIGNNVKLGIQFPLYDYLKSSTDSVLFSSMFSKLIAATIFYPLDLVRVNQRNSPDVLTIKEVCNSIYNNHGVRGFYRGVLLYNMVSTPNFVLMIFIKETLEKTLKGTKL